MKYGTGASRWLFLFALFCVILGAKFGEIGHYGSDLPFYDQWDAEGDELYRPYLAGNLTGADLVAPHNEHRILVTRLLALGLFVGNDHQWDVRVELLTNAVVHACVAGLLASIALWLLPLGAAAVYIAVVALFFSSAVDWENTLGGFQSQFYFLILFSLLHIGGTFLAKPRSLAWWLAPLAGAAALFSMASGPLSALAILAIVALRAWRARKPTRDDGWLVGINVVLFVAGWMLRIDVSGHESLKAPGFWAGCEAWLCQLAWPVLTPWASFLGLSPPLLLGWAYLRKRVEGPLALTLLAVCGWFWLQAAAIAYARGVNLGYSSRYSDILIVGVLLNFLVLIFLGTVAPQGRRWPWVLSTGVAATFLLAGLSNQDAEIRRDIFPGFSQLNANRIASVRSYVVNHDPAFFHKEPFSELPYPNATRLAEVLDKPGVSALLPANVRPPIILAVTSGFDANFAERPAPPGPGDVPLDLKTWTTLPFGAAVSPSAHFLSEPFAVDHHLLSVFVAGTAAKENVRFWIIDGRGVAHEPLDSAFSPSLHWKRVNFDVPKGALRLEVTVKGGWLAFTQPITDTSLSRFAVKAADSGKGLLVVGIGLFGVILGGVCGAGILSRRRISAP